MLNAFGVLQQDTMQERSLSLLVYSRHEQVDPYRSPGVILKNLVISSFCSLFHFALRTSLCSVGLNVYRDVLYSV